MLGPMQRTASIQTIQNKQLTFLATKSDTGCCLDEALCEWWWGWSGGVASRAGHTGAACTFEGVIPCRVGQLSHHQRVWST